MSKAFMIPTLSVIALMASFLATTASAEVKTKEVEYTVNGEPFTGFFAYDDAVSDARPGVLVVHEWWGHNDFARQQAKRLAQAGYTAFALDMYGKGKLAEHPDTAKKFMQATMGDKKGMRDRFEKAMSLLKNHDTVDESRIAAQGYCFGGAVVLNMARLGMDLDAVVSFHGSLGSDVTAEPGAIKAKVQAHTGGADPFAPPEQVASFVTEMQIAKAHLELFTYPGVKHSFTNPGADAMGKEFDMPLAYDQRVANQSFQSALDFYGEIFATR